MGVLWPWSGRASVFVKWKRGHRHSPHPWIWCAVKESVVCPFVLFVCVLSVTKYALENNFLRPGHWNWNYQYKLYSKAHLQVTGMRLQFLNQVSELTFISNFGNIVACPYLSLLAGSESKRYRPPEVPPRCVCIYSRTHLGSGPWSLWEVLRVTKTLLWPHISPRDGAGLFGLGRAPLCCEMCLDVCSPGIMFPK